MNASNIQPVKVQSGKKPEIPQEKEKKTAKTILKEAVEKGNFINFKTSYFLLTSTESLLYWKEVWGIFIF